MNLGVAAVIAMLSAPIVTNLVSSRQIMNTSFEPFRIVNTYGAFGSVTKDRSEIVFEGSRSDDPAKATDWQEYEFKGKPGSVDRRPCILSPYHYRDVLNSCCKDQNLQFDFCQLSEFLKCLQTGLADVVRRLSRLSQQPLAPPPGRKDARK